MSTSGSPDWAHMNVAAIWALLDGDNLEHAANRPTDWDNLAGALDDARRRLDAAAAQLEKVWPSSKNAAAQAFQDQVAFLSASMQETHAKAQNTTAGLSGVITALSAAKDTVAKLKQERESKANDLIPRWIDHAEDHLDTQAQDAMRQAEAAVADHSAQLQAPKLYVMNPGVQNADSRTIGDSSNSGSGNSALKAEPVPVSTSTSSPFDYPVTGRHGSDSPDQLGPVNGLSSSTGPALSGVLPVGSPPATLPSTFPVGGGPAGLDGNAAAFPSSSGALPSGLGVLAFGAGAFPGGVGGVGSIGGGVRQPVPVRTAMPSGTVIGGGSEQGDGPRGTTATQSLMGNSAGRGGRGRRGSEDTIEGTSDQLWQTREGVAAVIEPDRTPTRTDPGPGVIGNSW